MKTINNPSSYEFVEMTLLDSTTNRKNYEHLKKEYELFIHSYDALLSNKKMYGSSFENEAKKSIEMYEEKLSGIDDVFEQLKNKNQLDSVISYNYRLKARENNEFGAKVLNTYYFNVFPSGAVISMEMNEEDLSEAINPIFLPD